MKIVAFNGSPRVNGNTALLLKTVLGTVASHGIKTELVQLGGNLLHGCTACGECAVKRNKTCIIKNDRMNEFIAKAIEADAILIGSPTYYAGVSSEVKAFIDRAGYVCMSNGRLLKRKIGAAVVVQRRGGAVNVFDSINHWFMISGMVVPGSTYWNFGVGKEPGEVAGDEEAMRNMCDLGENIAWLLSCCSEGKQ